MGSIVAYRNPAHMPLRKCLKLFYSCILFQHGFSTREMVEKSLFLVDVFASVFPGTHVWNNLLNETQLAALCKNQRYRLSLRSQLLLLMPVSCLKKRMVCDDFSFHSSLTSTPSRSLSAFNCCKIAPNFFLHFLPVSKKRSQNNPQNGRPSLYTKHLTEIIWLSPKCYLCNRSPSRHPRVPPFLSLLGTIFGCC